MSKSLMSKNKECFVCKTTFGLHRHHVYGNSNRNNSERYGCWVYLCGIHHNLSNQGVHFNRFLDLWIKEECQRRWESGGRTREEFLKIFGRQYLD